MYSLRRLDWLLRKIICTCWLPKSIPVLCLGPLTSSEEGRAESPSEHSSLATSWTLMELFLMGLSLAAYSNQEALMV